ncbi:MAG: hypothetical protein WDO19_25895 [Bacteroidota bacterium]
MKKIFPAILFFPFTASLYAQQQDSLDNERLSKMINLSEVVIRSDINVASLLNG